MQLVIGVIIVLALIYWAQGDSTYIVWVAAVAGAVIGIPVLIGLVRQAGKRREKIAEEEQFQSFRAEAAEKNAPLRATILSHVAAWLQLKDDALDKVHQALDSEARAGRREALESMSRSLNNLIKVDDPDPAFLPKIKFGSYDLEISEVTTEDWNKRHIYQLSLRTDYHSRIDGKSPVDDGPKKLWDLALPQILYRDDVVRVARELGVIPEPRA